ncbi:2-C-methyl-D-erythritol 2,4-cyclodiphosphate synthase [Solemya pervernicosa gill symbiont]|uniref:2-C-methyl-D-erythritol 2,4-cyclodiphosphate synthase n=2 Tax=Gammaproteobacteria incertae sedis TaxID=118884 RepID=A0A1T2L824_9GAMM|nr:2-C-methyl-D-erythritol 2,4-cyclodiphosphate synthase [Candidatus Reidiella endopervernicosa]OOZ41202.1 2-C-methyl-D-erythritol 2,4-cyclodiphosphate synthase [Solemya pervernicosa gill symbiont]QKQ27072.1 2-C-methyl-D-erythritol 2,4-cyclodiphosphate synthase [Candidatus Reidiella endopervernicosa]
MKVGFGFDAHLLAEGRALVLGGVTIPYKKGLEAHSDGDVLIHALCDALLGAAGLGDIGKHFPDNSSDYAGIDSRILLRRVVELLDKGRYSISNADITVVAQQPKLAPHIDKMCENLAGDLKVEVTRVNVKATTTERMGYAGRGEGIAAYAAILLEEGA